MKIAVASDDGTTIASHFGKTRGFVIFDVEDGKVTGRDYVQNTFTGHARGLSGADHSADRHGPILQALSGCQAVISHGMGRRIYDDLRTARIQAFIVKETDADEAVRLFLQDRLQDHPDAGCRH
jgi:predicted Fe-Mo cluster-binding NifX family protein